MTWKSALGGISIATFVLAGVASADSSMQAAFGNTILSTYPDGRTAELWLHPDNSYDAEGRKGDPSSGRWSTKGDKLCLKQIKPSSSLISFCRDMPAEGLASGYSTKAVTGETIQVKLVHGRAQGHQGPPPS